MYAHLHVGLEKQGETVRAILTRARLWCSFHDLASGRHRLGAASVLLDRFCRVMFVTGFQDVLSPFKGIDHQSIGMRTCFHCMVSIGREFEIGDVLQATGISRGAGTRFVACR